MMFDVGSSSARTLVDGSRYVPRETAKKKMKATKPLILHPALRADKSAHPLSSHERASQ